MGPSNFLLLLLLRRSLCWTFWGASASKPRPTGAKHPPKQDICVSVGQLRLLLLGGYAGADRPAQCTQAHSGQQISNRQTFGPKCGSVQNLARGKAEQSSQSL